ncbi:hypothetical protein [Brevibacterium sediminis]
MSAPSAPVDVEVPGYGDIVLEEIDAATTLIKNAGEMLIEGQQTLADKLAGIADLDPEEISDEIAQARQEAIDAALAEIANVEGTLTSAINGKTTTTWSTSNPPASYSGAVGDTWVKLTSLGSGGREIRRSRWQGDVWVDHPVDGAVLSNVDASTITTGFLDVVNRIRAGAILADKLLIGGARNLIPNGDLSQGNASLWPSPTNGTGPTYSATDKPEGFKGSVSYHSTGTISPTDFGRWSVNGMTDLVFEVWAKADKPDSRIYVEVRDQDGALLGTASRTAFGTEGGWKGTPAAASYAYPVASYAVPTTWTRLRSTIKVPPETTEVYTARVYFNHSSGTERDATISLSGMRLAPMVDGTLITPGGVQTPHLAADVLEVGNLKAGTAALAEAVIKKLFAEVVVAQMVQANEFIGENAILTGAVTAPKITASEELTAKVAEFLRVRAEMIEADAIDGMVITAPTIQSARSGRRWVAGTDSIRVIDRNDDVRTQFSPEGSTFKGEVEADTLVVNEGAEFKANNTLAQGAILTLAAGVTDPTAPPVVQPFWGGLELSAAVDDVVGLAFDGTNYITARRSKASTVTSYRQHIYGFKINASTGAVAALDCDLVTAPGSPNGNVSEVFGVTCIGPELFWLGRYGYSGYVWVTDLSGVFKRRLDYPDLGYENGGSPLTYKPGIGNDGTNIVIGQCNDAGPLNVRTYNKTTGALISRAFDTGGGTRSDITGVYVGNADWGRKLNTVAQKRTDELTSFNPTTGAYDGDGTKFNAAAPGSTGVVYVDGKFRTLDPAGKIHEYADRNTGDTSGDWWATYYWYTDIDDDNIIESTDYQSRMAPPARFTWPRRAGLKILGQPMPDGVEALGPALAKKTTTPVRTDFSGPGWQVDAGKPSARYTSLPTNWTTFASPSATNTFPEAESSVIESASGTFKVQGDGSGYWGPLKMGRNGVMSGLVVTGQVSCKVDKAGTPKKFTVQLPAGRFTKSPVVWVSPLTTSPQNVAVSVVGAGITTTSFDLWFYRSDLSGTGVDWLAMDSE